MGAFPDNRVMMVGASYYDDFERRNGVWKIRKRGVVLHYFNPMPGVEMTAPA
jgi:gamma-hexachlorocyclohexane dehydrochlorinase